MEKTGVTVKLKGHVLVPSSMEFYQEFIIKEGMVSLLLLCTPGSYARSIVTAYLKVSISSNTG